MYETYYGLNANPFRLAPDPQFFYESACHKRGLAYLRYGLHQGQGFVVVTGVPGTGKSLLIQTMLAELAGQRIIVSSIKNTNLEADDVLRTVASSLGIYCGDTTKAALLNALEKFLIDTNSNGQRVLLIVDEAQNLPLRSLEELRMLSNFQRAEQPLIQIMLLGQQQFQTLLADPDMEQLSQRVIASCHLKPLSPVETRGYIEYRLSRVGWRGKLAFTGEALGLIHHITQGIPRIINTYCDRLLLAAYLDEKQLIDTAHVGLVLKELQAEAMGSCWGYDLSTVVPVALPPLPDGEFVPVEAKTPVVTEAHAELPEEPLPAVENEPQLVEQEPLVALPVEAVAELPPSSVAEISEEPSAQPPFMDDDDKVVPVQSESVAAEVALANVIPIPLVRTRSPLGEEGQSSELAYRNPDVRGARVRRVFIVVATLAVIVVLPFIIFTGDDKQVSQVESFQPEPQSQGAALQPEPLMSESTGDGEFSDIATEEMLATTESQGDGTEAVVDIHAAAATAVPQQEAAPASGVAVKTPVSKPETLPAPVPPAKAQLVKPVVVAKVATPSAASAPQIVAEVKPMPILPAKTAPAPEPQPVIKPAPVPVIVDPSPSSPVRVPDVTAAPVKSQINAGVADVAAPKLAISDVDLTQLLYKFVFAYEGGDLDGLTGLFANNAMADDSVGRSRIARDYRELFQSTDMRRMSIGTLNWRPDGAMMHGSGDFEVTVWRRGDDDPTTIKGKLNMDVSKVDKQLVIRKLTHAVSR